MVLKNTVPWAVMPCSSEEAQRFVAACFLVVFCMVNSSTSKMVAVGFSETSGFFRTARCWNPDDRIFVARKCASRQVEVR
jgi:hypothetical protein